MSVDPRPRRGGHSVSGGAGTPRPEPGGGSSRPRRPHLRSPRTPGRGRSPWPAGRSDGVARRGAPSQRAGDEHMQVAGAADLHRVCDLGLEVVQLRDGRRGDIGDLVGHRDQRHVLALPKLLPGHSPSGSVVAVRAAAASRRSAGRRCSCRPRCRNRCRARHRPARTSPTGRPCRCRPSRRRRPGRRRGRRCGPWPAGRPRCPSRQPARWRTASGSRAAATRSRGRAWRRPPGSRWRCRDQAPLGGPQRRVERVAGAQRLAAPLAGAVALGQGVGPLRVRLHR